jgi:hypothetical protein
LGEGRGEGIPPALRYALLIFPLAYLLLPTLEAAVLYDFHAVTLAPTFLLFGLLALERRHTGRFFLFMLLAMACKEDMPLVVAMVGLYAGLAQGRWRLAGATIALAAGWFAVAVLVIQPQFAAGGNIQLDRYAWLGDSPGAMLVTMFTQPGLVIDHLWRQARLPDYLTALFFPTAFMALLNPLTLLPMLPTLAINLLSANPFTWRLEDFHYGAPLAPFLLVSAMVGLRRLANVLSPHLGRYTLAALLGLILAANGIYHYYRGFSPLARPWRWPEYTAHHHQLDTVLAEVPPESPLFAQSNLAPHLSQRPLIYTDFAYFTDPAFPAAAPVQDIVLDVSTLENRGGLHQYVRDNLLGSGKYQIVTAQAGILHLQPADGVAAPVQLTPSAFLPEPAPLDFSLSADFGDAVRLRGFSLHFNRQEEVQVTVELAALRPLSGVQPVLYLLDAAGQPVGATTDLPPALVWYPPEAWQPGQPVQVRFNTLPWYTRQTPAYRLALGVLTGNDAWDVAARLRPDVAPETPWAVRLPADGTLIELAEIRQVGGMPAGGPQARRFEAPSPSQTTAANFAGQVELAGYDAPTIAPDGTVSVTLYWRAVALPERLTRFVQLVGPDGQVYGQQDAAPDNGQYPTSGWQSGEVVSETVTFAAVPERPAGEYRLHVGLYRPDTGERLPLTGGGDHVEIGVTE